METRTSGHYKRDQALCLAALVLATFSLRAQELHATLDLQTVSGQTRFHVGERILLKLTFSNPYDPGFEVTDDSDLPISPVLGVDREQEFDCNKFQVTPATGWSDPLATYLARQDRMFSGQWPPHPLMAAKPETAMVDLNQWVRFDEPGDYTVTVTSHCVQRKSPPSFEEIHASIELHIVAATEQWQAEKLRSIQAQLRLQRGTPAWESAVKDLRYLATPAGVEEMTSGFRNTWDGFKLQHWAMGLEGLPESLHGLAIDSMERRIQEPDFPISPQFFSAMTFLHATPDSDTESIHQLTSGWAAPLWMEILGAVPQKTGSVLTLGANQSRLTLPARFLPNANHQADARAQTIQTLVTLDYIFPSLQVKAQLGTLLRGSFASLDRPAQLNDLRAHWDELNSPDFLPVLEALAESPLGYTPRFGDFGETDLKSLAYFRWYELDPAGARKQIFAEIGSESPTLPAQSVAFLPPEPMPDLEPIWLRQFLGGRDQLAERAFGSLLVRFGTGAAAEQMAALFEKPEQPDPAMCDMRLVALAYLARFATERALPLLRSEAKRNNSPCGPQLLRSLADLAAPAPALEQLALEELNGADTQSLGIAIQYLESYGTQQDEAPLWRRYVQWSDANKGNAAAFDQREPHLLGEMNLGNELAVALMRSQGWLADKELIARVSAKCVGEMICDNLKGFAEWVKPPYRIMFSNTLTPIVFGYLGTAQVAQYGPRTLELFDQKIAQYPKGSHFVSNPYHSSTGDAIKLEILSEGDPH